MLRMTEAEIKQLEDWLYTQPDWRELFLTLDKQCEHDGVVGWELLAAVRRAREKATQ